MRHSLTAGIAADDEENFAGDVARVLREVRNTYAGAISSGWAGRFIGVSSPNVLTSFVSLSDGLSGVHTGPGATAEIKGPQGDEGAQGGQPSIRQRKKSEKSKASRCHCPE